MFFKPQKKTILETKTFKLFTKGGISIFRYPQTSASNIYKILKKIRHPNILSIIEFIEKTKYYDLQHNIYYDLKTIILTPFELSNTNFDFYILYTINDVLQFLHKKCFVVHQNLVLESLFLNNNGSLILGGFEKAIIIDKNELNDNHESHYRSDIIMFKDLCCRFGYDFKEITDIYKKRMNLKENEINNNFEDRDASDKNIIIDKYLFIEECITIFDILDNEKRLKLMFIANKDLPLVIKNRLVKLFLKIDILNIIDQKKYKNQKNTDEQKNELKFSCIIDFFIKLDLPSYDEPIKKMMSILDSSFRIELLKKIDFFINKVNWNDSSLLKNFLLGLACKNLSKITLISLDKIFYTFNNESKILFVRAAKNIDLIDSDENYSYNYPDFNVNDYLQYNFNDDFNNKNLNDDNLNKQSRNSDEILASIIKNNHLYLTFPDEIYKLILKNLDSLEIVTLIHNLLCKIGIKVICTELLPEMCIQILKNKDLIPEIVKILDYLENNKDEIKKVDDGSWISTLKKYANQSIENIKSKTGIKSKSLSGIFKWKDDEISKKKNLSKELINEVRELKVDEKSLKKDFDKIKNVENNKFDNKSEKVVLKKKIEDDSDDGWNAW
ncbi:N-terminal kinase-like protein [Dictyocoela muelleri]|nr:N-terminal kinase-like protein [Dictyocoela muelleri]